MKKLLFAAFAVLATSAIYAEDFAQMIQEASDKALYQINGKTVSKAEAQALDINSIESVTVQTQEEAPEDVKGKAANGYVSIYTKVKSLSEAERKNPQFKGGDEALKEYISASLVYPEEDKANKVNGYVVVKFMVQQDGAIKNPEISRSLSPACDAEALRIVKLMPNWEPGMAGGQPQISMYQLPILFKCPKSNQVKRGRPSQTPAEEPAQAPAAQ